MSIVTFYYLRVVCCALWPVVRGKILLFAGSSIRTYVRIISYVYAYYYDTIVLYLEN